MLRDKQQFSRWLSLNHAMGEGSTGRWRVAFGGPPNPPVPSREVSGAPPDTAREPCAPRKKV